MRRIVWMWLLAGCQVGPKDTGFITGECWGRELDGVCTVRTIRAGDEVTLDYVGEEGSVRDGEIFFGTSTAPDEQCAEDLDLQVGDSFDCHVVLVEGDCNITTLTLQGDLPESCH